jgi:putative transposase
LQLVGANVDVIKRQNAEFKILPKRWIVERTFSWLAQNRRLSKDYEMLPEVSETMIYIAMVRLMLRRLTSNKIAT